jgi:hypothetical protein
LHFPLFPLLCVLALLALSALPAFAQANGIPGDQDYSAFSRFVTDRNIFNPDRQPHSSSSHSSTRRRHRTEAPGIQFVGTMSYEKGMFAFFSGNSSEYSKVVQVGGKIADYTVTDLTATKVVLESADKKQLAIAVGGGLKQQNGKWVSADAADAGETAGAPGAASGSDATTSAGNDDSSSEPAAPPSSSEPNDVLKRLMQQREKENQ